MSQNQELRELLAEALEPGWDGSVRHSEKHTPSETEHVFSRTTYENLVAKGFAVPSKCPVCHPELAVDEDKTAHCRLCDDEHKTCDLHSCIAPAYICDPCYRLIPSFEADPE